MKGAGWYYAGFAYFMVFVVWTAGAYALVLLFRSGQHGGMVGRVVEALLSGVLMGAWCYMGLTGILGYKALGG